MLHISSHIKPINSNFSWPRAGCLALQSKVRLDYGASTKCRDRRHHASASMAASDKSWSPKGLDGTSAVYWDIFMNTFLWCLVLPSWLPKKRVERWPSEHVLEFDGNCCAPGTSTANVWQRMYCGEALRSSIITSGEQKTFDERYESDI
jgi:hypothetical protein